MIRDHGCIFGSAVLVLIYVSIFILGAGKNVYARKRFHAERPQLGIELIYDFENESRTGPDSSTQNEIQDIRERLVIETSGWVFHPAFCRYDLQFMPEFTQRTDENDTQKGQKNSFSQGYYLRASFLPLKPYSFSLFGQKQTIPMRSAFASQSETDTETFGASVNLKYPGIPTSLNYTQRERVQKGFYLSKEKSENWTLSSSHIKGNSATHLNASYDIRNYATGNTTTKTDTLNSSIRNTYRTAGERKIGFNTGLSQRLSESDGVENSGINFSENIDWEHRKNLRSSYRFTYNHNKAGENFNETRAFGAGLNHLLYENLNTNLTGNTQQHDFTGGQEKSYGGNLLFNYNRKIPWGFLSMNIGHSYQIRERNFDEDFIAAIDEPHVLSGVDLTFLDNEDVVIGSIRVTNITGTVVYRKDKDYETREIGSFVQIKRTFVSDISDGETVLVSYEYQSTPSHEDRLFRKSYSVSLDLWSHLKLSYSYEHTQQKLLSGVLPDVPQDDTINTAALELTYGPTFTKLLYETADRSAGNSTRTWRADETITIRPAVELLFGFIGSLGSWDYKNEVFNETQDFASLALFVDWAPLSWGKLSLRGFRSISSGDSENTEDTGIEAAFQWSYGIWNGTLKYAYSEEIDKTDNQALQIQNIRFEIIRIKF